jgi:DNA-directed RNA polymerase specialized sigma24 family protein
MSVVAGLHQVQQVEAFYKRWSPDVFVFCRLFLGNEPTAELLTSEAFLNFYRTSSLMPTSGEVPPQLVGAAFQAMQPCQPELDIAPPNSALEKCILLLDCQQRAAFIMRNVLGMTWPGVASAMKLSVEQVKQHWLKAMLRLRDLLPRDFFDR